MYNLGFVINGQNIWQIVIVVVKEEQNEKSGQGTQMSWGKLFFSLSIDMVYDFMTEAKILLDILSCKNKL